MPKRIALPDGSIGEFPDTMSDAAIESVLQRQFSTAPKEQSTLGTVLNTLNAPGSALRSGIRTALQGGNFMEGAKQGLTISGPQTSTADILKDFGMGNTGYARDIAGLAGDVVLDPLNAIPLAPALKMLGAGAKAIKGSTLGKAIGGSDLMQDLGRAVIPHFNAPNRAPLAGVGPTYREQKALLGMRQRGGAALARREGQEVAAGIDPTLWRDIPDVIEGTFKGQLTPELQGAADKVRAHFATRATRETDAGILDPAKLKQDYFTYLFPKDKGAVDASEVWRRSLSANSRFSKARTLDEWKQAVAAGAETDLAKVLSVRASVGERAAITGDWAGEIATKFGQPTAAPGWRKVSIPGVVSDSPLAKTLEKTYFPEEVAADLTEVLNFTPQKLNTLQKTFEAVTASWKTLATTANPGFHLRNAISNGWLMSASGMSPIDVANNMARGVAAASGKATGMDVAGQSADHVMQLAHKFGIVESGHLQEFADSVGQAGRVVTDFIPGAKQYVTGMRKVGDVAEQGARLGMFRHFLGKGETAEQAALKVRKYMFNYHELTDAERNVRRYIIPFYAWMRKSAPIVAESFLANPKLWSRTDSLTNMFERMAQEAGSLTPDKSLRDYERDDIQLPALPGKAQTLMSNPFPVTEVTKWTNPIETLGSALNPMLKAPIELATNRSLFTGADIAPELVRGVEPSWTGPKNASGAMSQVAGKLMGYPKWKGRQQNNVAMDYAINQIPFLPTRIFSTGTEIAEGDVGGALERVVGLTRSKDAKELATARAQETKRRRDSKKAEGAIKKRSGRSKSRLDELASRVGIQ